MKKLQTVIVGLGNRGCIYGDYSLQEKNELEIVGLVDTNPFVLEQARKKYKVSKERCFSSIKDFVNQNIKCDFVINATMDQIHYETSIELLNAGYNLLLEKPIVENEKKLLNIVKLANKNHCKILVCHVLRYTEFYKKIKETVDSGVIGTINSMQLNEHVWIVHFINSYVRGKWRSEKECGSPLLLAKSCHDMDLICWINNKTRPVKVSSFGSRKMYCPENAPKGATQYCYQCPLKDKCIYNAEFMEAKIDRFPFLTWRHIDKPLNKITMKEKLAYLKKDTMGQCVYKTDMDIVDRQSIIIEFENGSVTTFNLVGGVTQADRSIHIVGSEGEIFGSLSDNKFTLRTINKKNCMGKDKIIDCAVIKSDGRPVDSHFGGDYAIMKNTCAYFRGDKTSIGITKLADSVNSHLVCYAAEKSRKSGKVVKIKKADC